MAKSILTSVQNKILQTLGKIPLFSSNYYLTGGTALAEYYLHHRLSDDLDFFTESEVDKIWLNTLVKKISTSIKAEKSDLQESFNRNLVYFVVDTQTIKTEFTYFPFKQIEKPRQIYGVNTDSLIDIAVNKFFTIYQKPSARHFIDLYLILAQQKYTWEQLKKLARIKFDTNIDPLQLGSQLILAAEVKDMPKMLINLPEAEWRDYFIQKAKSLKDQIVR